MNHTHCRICGREFFPEILLELKNMPSAAQHFPTSETLADDRGIDLELRQCSCCGVVQLTNPPVPYFRDVIRAAGCSPEMREFRLKQFSEWIKEFQLQNAKILEVGCGKGEYLEIMRDAGGKVFGTEHLDESVKVCREHGLNVEPIYFEHGDEQLKNGPFGGFFILNWLEHSPDLHTFLQGIRNNLTPDAAGLVEVPNFDMMLKKGLSAEFTADHLYYFTEESFRVTLESCGFQVLSCRPVWHDYILSANVRRKQPLDASLFSRKQQTLVQEIDAFVNRYAKTAIWGAGHQALAVMAMAGLDRKICYVVDSAPFKQGKFTHATHLPIVPPDQLKTDPPDAVLVMCAGFSDEVTRILREQYDPAIRIGILREDHVEELSC